jgi:hypothetical protein
MLCHGDIVEHEMKERKPVGKRFDVMTHEDLVRLLEGDAAPKEFEKACRPLVLDILENYEGFDAVEQGPGFPGTPFDFFGFRTGIPYVVEFKGSRFSFNSPGETQKRRLMGLLDQLPEVGVALLQVKVCKGMYRIFYNEEMKFIFSSRTAPLDPIVSWVRQRLDQS